MYFTLIFPLILLGILVTIFKRFSTKEPPLPPGPYPWPIIGNLFQIGENPHINLANLAQTHGPLMSLRFGSMLAVVGSSPAAASEILKTHDRALSGRFVSNPFRVKGSKFHNLGVGFLEECNDRWKSLRAVYRTEVFSANALESQGKVRERKVMELVRYLGSVAKEGQVVKIKHLAFTCVLNIIGNSLLSIEDLMEFEDEQGKGKGKGSKGGLGDYITELVELERIPQLSDLYPYFGTWDIQGFYKNYVHVFDKMCAVWDGTLNEKRRNQRNGISGPRDLTNALIGIGFTNEQISPVLLELFSAGTESTSAIVEWALTELIRNREAMNTVRDELEKVTGGDIIRESNLPNLPYLEACIKEILRLHPTAPLLLAHRAVQTCQVMGYTIPKNSTVMVNMWAIARDPKIWDDPLKFRPERWFLESKLEYKGTDFEYIPFGSGRRICPGMPLATKMIQLIVGSLIQQFDWVLPGDMNPNEIDMSERFGVITSKEEPLCVIPKLRKLSTVQD